MRRKKHPEKYWYGPLELDAEGAYILQRFAQCAYNEWRNEVPIPRKLEPYSFNDFRSKLWWKLYRMYEDGAFSFELELFDIESDRPPPDLSRLADKFSKEV
ncbi:hypothetical protein [Polynucleobacter sp. JS-JIR-5-A7]|uniref:hypothetical protein n=1 Tax=Polynucleobacter sp. JS-JIR-5-A7 TaxID=1758395 RepID=UPI001BFDE2D9|nr:hypothetical protein [Polynucleobacter sp. JS-JIR-5-A7]QWE06050.1 hypothetical protein AOC29_07985 [Polynucleobacter sp. JS-JIR-5-A7]